MWLGWFLVLGLCSEESNPHLAAVWACPATTGALHLLLTWNLTEGHRACIHSSPALPHSPESCGSTPTLCVCYVAVCHLPSPPPQPTPVPGRAPHLHGVDEELRLGASVTCPCLLTQQEEGPGFHQTCHEACTLSTMSFQCWPPAPSLCAATHLSSYFPGAGVCSSHKGRGNGRGRQQVMALSHHPATSTLELLVLSEARPWGGGLGEPA